MHTFLLVIITAPVMALIDYLWLGVIAGSFYTSRLGGFIRPVGARFDIHIIGAVAVYVLFAIGITVFSLPKIHSNSSALLWGALFGFLIYGLYNFTNWSVLTVWPASLLLVDILYGSVLGALLSLGVHHLDKLLP